MYTTVPMDQALRPSASTDPLQRLGDSLVLQILGSLPLRELLLLPRLSKAYIELYIAHASGIFRPACHRFAVDAAQLDQLAKQEAGVKSRHPGPILEDAVGGQEEALRVDWKAALRRHIIWDRNWKHGHCEDKWITLSDVWRFKLDPEDDCCISTSKRGRIEVVDAQSSTPLFSIGGVRPYAHLEFANGFAVFDNGQEPMQLEIWRNRHALARSSHPEPFGQTLADHRPMMAEELLTSRNDPASAAINVRFVPAKPPLTRGNLAFYRHIMPPERCRAFRGRVDFKGTPEERSVICMAGDRGVFIYDLEEGSLVQHIKTHEQAFCSNLQYVEIDDENVFICTAAFFFIFSRRTHRLVLRYPEYFDSAGHPSVGLNAAFDPAQAPAIPDSSLTTGSADQAGSAAAADGVPVGSPTGSIPGYSTRRPATTRPILPQIVDIGRPDDRVFVDFEGTNLTGFARDMLGFDACHYALDDLIYTGNGNRTYVTRNYRQVLQIADDEMRRKAWIDHTIALTIDDGVSDRFSNLATDSSHVVLASTDRLLFFDTSTLPDIPSQVSNLVRDASDRDSPAAVHHSIPQGSDVAELATTARLCDGTTVPQTGTLLSDHTSESATVSTPALNGPTIHIIDSLDRRGLCRVSCVQADKDQIYVTYVAPHDHQRSTDPPPDLQLMRGQRVRDCIRVWNFAPRD